MEHIIGIGEFAISSQHGDYLKTFALGSCIGLTAYSSSRHVAGMIHIALPFPKDSSDGRVRPMYYASTGLPLLFNKLNRDYGCLLSELEIRIFGGAVSQLSDDYFEIGRRNLEEVHNQVSALGLNVCEEQTGGTISRTLIMEVASGMIQIISYPVNF